MRAQQLNIMLVDMLQSPETMAHYRDDPEAVAELYGVTSEELEHLKAEDMGWLYVHGAHPYALVQFSFVIKHDFREYIRKLQEATAQRKV